ncbi:MAG: GNAT family N-acetyltransferase [Roseburia sp.]|nr:GNAT family N-acetyltransferase [Roseburia sp.]
MEEQLSIDYNCTIKDVQSSENVYQIFKVNKKARPIGNADTLLKIAVYNEKLLVMANSELLEWCKKSFENQKGTWLSEPENLIKINRKLLEYGQRLVDAHHHYIPAWIKISVEQRFDVKWYEKNEIEVFRGDNRFWEALLFDENTPDMLAVCAVEDDIILGMANATRDCERLWQIGVNVTQEGCGKGVGSYVTTLLKEELLNRGIVPMYATVESHIKSQKVAFKSGFMPAFYEIFSE